MVIAPHFSYQISIPRFAQLKWWFQNDGSLLETFAEVFSKYPQLCPILIALRRALEGCKLKFQHVRVQQRSWPVASTSFFDCALKGRNKNPVQAPTSQPFCCSLKGNKKEQSTQPPPSPHSAPGKEKANMPIPSLQKNWVLRHQRPSRPPLNVQGNQGALGGTGRFLELETCFLN